MAVNNVDDIVIAGGSEETCRGFHATIVMKIPTNSHVRPDDKSLDHGN